MDDHELLQQYTRHRSQDAFRELVERHLPMVYATATRMVRNPHLAEDVAQKVFITLAQKSSSINSSQVLGGWVYNTTRYLALHEVRSEVRRQEREQTALTMQDLNAGSEPEKIMEQLEPALTELDEADRDALVLRFLENRSLREVGAELRISEDAARMRVNRAVERLRDVLGRQGISVSLVALTAVLGSTTANAAVPAGLAVSATTAAITTTSATTTITMSWINAKVVAAIVGASVLTGTGAYFSQQRQIDRLQTQNHEMSVQQQKMESDQRKALDRARAAEKALQQSGDNARELAKLRSEVGKLRQSDQDIKSLVIQGLPGGAVGTNGLIVAGELLSVTVQEDASLSTTYLVRRGGYILMKNVGRIPVVAKNIKEAETIIKEKLAVNLIPNAHVTVERGADSINPVIYLEGEFKHPGPWLISPGFAPTALTTILRSGGTTTNADLTHVRVLRNNGGQGLVDAVNLQAILNGTGTSDIPLNAGDVIVVPALKNATNVNGTLEP